MAYAAAGANSGIAGAGADIAAGAGVSGTAGVSGV